MNREFSVPLLPNTQNARATLAFRLSGFAMRRLALLFFGRHEPHKVAVIFCAARSRASLGRTRVPGLSCFCLYREPRCKPVKRLPLRDRQDVGEPEMHQQIEGSEIWSTRLRCRAPIK